MVACVHMCNESSTFGAVWGGRFIRGSELHSDAVRVANGDWFGCLGGGGQNLHFKSGLGLSQMESEPVEPGAARTVPAGPEKYNIVLVQPKG